MSTRSIIRFVQGKNSVTIYRHSDGYPSGVLPDMERFLKWNGWRSADMSYTVVNFLAFFKLENALRYGDKSLKLMLEKPDFNSQLHLGFGILSSMTEKDIIESWAEFFYEVNFDTNTITTFSNGKKLVKLGESKMIIDENDKHDKSYSGIKHSKKIEKEIENY